LRKRLVNSSGTKNSDGELLDINEIEAELNNTEGDESSALIKKKKKE